jgi:hypothetical protein
MNQEQILKKLKDDKHYYGEFGQQFLSNSDIGKLFKNPLALREPTDKTVNLMVGSYLHTLVLQPDKIDTYKVLNLGNRNLKAYKEAVATDGEICLLQHEVDKIELMRDALMGNRIIRDLIAGSYEESKIDYEVPGIKDFYGNTWKGKADVINHEERLVIDLKSTSDIDRFQWSVRDYNYDSQAYLYSQIFGYDFIFVVIDKNTLKITIFEVSDETLQRGESKVAEANAIYDLYYKNENFDPSQYVETKII